MGPTLPISELKTPKVDDVVLEGCSIYASKNPSLSGTSKVFTGLTTDVSHYLVAQPVPFGRDGMPSLQHC